MVPLGVRNDCMYICVYKFGLRDRLHRRLLQAVRLLLISVDCALVVSCFPIVLFRSFLGLYGAPYYNPYADYDALEE
jgi:hypothetical protein